MLVLALSSNMVTTMQHGECADVVLGLAGALLQRLLAMISHLYCWLGAPPVCGDRPTVLHLSR